MQTMKGHAPYSQLHFGIASIPDLSSAALETVVFVLSKSGWGSSGGSGRFVDLMYLSIEMRG